MYGYRFLKGCVCVDPNIGPTYNQVTVTNNGTNIATNYFEADQCLPHIVSAMVCCAEKKVE